MATKSIEAASGNRVSPDSPEAWNCEHPNMDEIFGVVGSLVGGLALVWIGAAAALLVLTVYLLARAHNMGTIRFSVAGLELVFARVISLIMVLVAFLAVVKIFTAALSLGFGDEFAYGGGSDVDELEVLVRWAIYGALALVIYFFMLIRARRLASSPPARFVRTAYLLAASGFFCVTSIIYTFRLAGAVIDAVIESGGVFDRGPAVGQPLAILVAAVLFLLLATYFTRRPAAA